MKKQQILYLCHRIPYPPNKGDKIRSYNQVRFLSEHADVDLVTLADDPGDLAHESVLTQMCRRVEVFSLNRHLAKIRGMWELATGRSISQGYFYHPGFQQTVDAWVSSTPYDAIVCFSSPMAGYLLKGMPEYQKHPKYRNRSPARFIMDFCDLDSDKWRQYARQASFPMNFVYNAEGKRLLAFEKKIARAFDHSVFVSRAEADLFVKAFPGAGQVGVIPNGVDFDSFSPDRVTPVETTGAPMLMFPGAMDYHANVEGVCWFVREIFPQVRQQVPDAVFYIVGSNPVQKVRDLEKTPGVIVTGFVADIRQYYRAADLCVIPLTIARGVQNKVLEAMAMEKPVVSTSVAVQGISASHGRDLVVADAPGQFARDTVRLLQDRDHADAYGFAARQFVRNHHDWDQILKMFYATLFMTGEGSTDEIHL